jgi:hypothetical protein
MLCPTFSLQGLNRAGMILNAGIRPAVCICIGLFSCLVCHFAAPARPVTPELRPLVARCACKKLPQQTFKAASVFEVAQRRLGMGWKRGFLMPFVTGLLGGMLSHYAAVACVLYVRLAQFRDQDALPRLAKLKDRMGENEWKKVEKQLRALNFDVGQVNAALQQFNAQRTVPAPK